jgi:hypothetical protein
MPHIQALSLVPNTSPFELGSVPKSYHESLPGPNVSVATNLSDSVAALEIQSRAIKIFNQKLSPTDGLRVDTISTFSDVLREVQVTLQRLHDNRSPLCGKVERFLKRLDEYSVVGDIMVQHNSAIGSLVWGGIRLVLRLALNNFEILEKIVDNLDNIFLHLGRVELYSSMFRINRVEEGISTLYSYILEFVQRAVRFLKKGGFGRLTSALWRPYKLEFQEAYTNIREYADFVEKEANAANMIVLQGQNRELARQLEEVTQALAAHTTSVEAMSSRMADLHTYQISQENMIKDYRNGECIILARRLTKYIAAAEYIDNAASVLTNSIKYLPADGCEWILRDPLFIKWKNTDKPNFLALTGGRGTGKFVLSSFITAHLLEDTKISKSVVWFHSVLWGKEALTPTLMLRCFIAQLLRKRPDVLMRKSASFYKKRFKAAKALQELFSLFVDIVSVVGKIFMMVDGLDSCPNNAILTENLLQLSESGLPLKVIITAMEDPNLGPVLQDVAKIRLESESVVCDISQYVSSQLVANFPLLKDIHSDLAMAIVTGAGGNVGWARYILWGLARSENDDGIARWRKIAAKGRDVVYGRQFDTISQAIDSRRLGLIKLILRALLANENGLSVREIYESITTRNATEPGVLLNTFDPTAWDETAIETNLNTLESLPTPFVTCRDKRYSITDSTVRNYLLDHIPSQRPPVPHLWMPTDTCMLQCQLKHWSHSEQFADGSLQHMRADFKDFVPEPGQFRK